MSSHPPVPSEHNFLKILKTMLSWKMAVMFFFGFSSGLPFYIIKDVLKLWMTDNQVDIGTIGLFALLGMPYTLKFIWSPMMDGIVPPFLGRRRGWILMTQIGLMITIAILGQFDPKTSLWWIAFFALCVNFFGASQDISLDAFRREYLSSDELGFGTGVWMNAWRLGTFFSVGLSVLADHDIEWSTIFFLLSGLMGIGVLTNLMVPEPEIEEPLPTNLKEAVVEPFVTFFNRRGATLILLFILLYKLGDNMASTMTIPYVVALGFSKADYFVIVKGVGTFGLFGGVLVGGSIMIRLGIAKSLYLFGLLQAVSTALFACLKMIDHTSMFWQDYSMTLLGSIVSFEFFATGLGQAAYASYMALQTDKRFTATQYALLTSLMGVPGVFAAAATGYMSKFLGWPLFYLVCSLVAVPGLLLLFKIAPWHADNQALENRG